eukprot:NODE_726_length_1682_cov_47.490032_g716_i0.p1 GENE.NODE_726_length_1682_cov_47.490032_g716_i0~~NODE_726_length_1682_cov_47.490032_g716_i0.p1  ORF type:complete len:255 (+),score=44.82 NODE_726_length_1682_cov_47.490032_g716_i0:822-1586(+)
MEHVDLTNCGIGDRGVMALAEALVKCSRLWWLMVGDNPFSARGTAALVRAALKLPHLRTVRFGGTYVEAEWLRTAFSISDLADFVVAGDGVLHGTYHACVDKYPSRRIWFERADGHVRLEHTRSWLTSSWNFSAGDVSSRPKLIPEWPGSKQHVWMRNGQPIRLTVDPVAFTPTDTIAGGTPPEASAPATVITGESRLAGQAEQLVTNDQHIGEQRQQLAPDQQPTTEESHDWQRRMRPSTTLTRRRNATQADC